MARAAANSELKGRFFTTPFQLSITANQGGGKRQQERERATDGTGQEDSRKKKRGAERPPSSSQQGGRGAGKAKGKGGKGLWSRTPDGRNICFKYNNVGEDCDSKCGMVHVCQRCFGKHPQYDPDCPKKE